MWQRCWLMWQHCQSCDNAVVNWCDSTVNHATVPLLIDVTAMLTGCDSAVNHATVQLLMWRHCWRYVTALSITGQCHHWCDSSVNVMQQRCWSHDCAVDHVTVLSSMWHCCQHDATVLLIMWQCRHQCDSAVNVMQQHCQSFCQMIGSTVRWSTVPSHAWKLCYAIDNKVIQRTVSSLKWL
jgi:hypothetical protein